MSDVPIDLPYRYPIWISDHILSLCKKAAAKKKAKKAKKAGGSVDMIAGLMVSKYDGEPVDLNAQIPNAIAAW